MRTNSLTAAIRCLPRAPARRSPAGCTRTMPDGVVTGPKRGNTSGCMLTPPAAHRPGVPRSPLSRPAAAMAAISARPSGPGIEQRLPRAAEQLGLEVEADRRDGADRHASRPAPRPQVDLLDVDDGPFEPRVRRAVAPSMYVRIDPVLVRRQRHAEPAQRQRLEPLRAPRLGVAAGLASGVARHRQVDRDAVPVRHFTADDQRGVRVARRHRTRSGTCARRLRRTPRSGTAGRRTCLV